MKSTETKTLVSSRVTPAVSFREIGRRYLHHTRVGTARTIMDAGERARVTWTRTLAWGLLPGRRRSCRGRSLINQRPIAISPADKVNRSSPSSSQRTRLDETRKTKEVTRRRERKREDPFRLSDREEERKQQRQQQHTVAHAFHLHRERASMHAPTGAPHRHGAV